MTWISVIAITALWCLSLVTPSPPPNDLFQPINGSHIHKFYDSHDPVLVWAQYERFLLSKRRMTPLLLYFTPGLTCYNKNEDDDDDDDQSQEESTITEVLAVAREACLHHDKQAEAAVGLAAETLSSQFPIVRIDIHTWPQVLHYHLVSSTPSLLWIPERTSGKFQRYPHIETNFVDLSMNGSLYSEKLDVDTAKKQNNNAEVYQHDEVVKEAVAKKIVAFVHLCQERSGYLVRNVRGRLVPAVPARPDHGASLWVEMILIIAVLTFVAFVVNENRDFVFKIVRTRFFWFVICLGVIFIALSGLFHSIIHRQALWYFDHIHGFVFVHPSSRRQFMLEGLIHGTWSFWFSLAQMSISDVLPTLRSQVAREDLMRWSLLLVTFSYAVLHLAFLIKYKWLA